MKKAKREKIFTFGSQILIEIKGYAAAVAATDLTALITLPPFIQRVQTFIREFPPAVCWTRIDCRFGLNRRRVLLLACETLFPNCGPLPQTSHRFAIIKKASKI